MHPVRPRLANFTAKTRECVEVLRHAMQVFKEGLERFYPNALREADDELTYFSWSAIRAGLSFESPGISLLLGDLDAHLEQILGQERASICRARQAEYWELLVANLSTLEPDAALGLALDRRVVQSTPRQSSGFDIATYALVAASLVAMNRPLRDACF